MQIGYKIFRRKGVYGTLVSALVKNPIMEAKYSEKHWNFCKHILGFKKHGFCYFKNLHDAARFMNSMNTDLVHGEFCDFEIWRIKIKDKTWNPAKNKTPKIPFEKILRVKDKMDYHFLESYLEGIIDHLFYPIADWPEGTRMCNKIKLDKKIYTYRFGKV